MKRLYPNGIEINSHEKLIEAMDKGGFEYEILLEVLQEVGYTGDTFSYGDLIKVFGLLEEYTSNGDMYITEEEYFQMLAKSLNELEPIQPGPASTPEYLKFRCCMCPNSSDDPESMQCPAGMSCRFVKVYIDERGWKYRVMPGLGENNFKARYQKPDKTSWKCMSKLDWCSTFDEAQKDLNALAKSKGWKVCSN